MKNSTVDPISSLCKIGLMTLMLTTLSACGGAGSSTSSSSSSSSSSSTSSGSSSSSSGGQIDSELINTAAPALRRLNRTEYDNTMRDLFGSNSRIASTNFRLEAQGSDNFFYKDGKGRNVLKDDVIDYMKAAETIVSAALTDNIPELTCVVQDEACVVNIIANFGKRIWRRPLTTAEQTSLLGIYKAGVARNGPFNENLGSVLQALLVSPNFIFLPEFDENLPNIHPLNAYELATRLSYFIWSSTPDQELMAAAENNSLLNDAVLRSHVKRMLQDPKADNLVSDFSTQWLKFSREYATSIPNKDLFEAYNPALHADMGEETRLFMQNLIFNNQPVDHLVTANYSFLNLRLEEFYGLAYAGNNLIGINSAPIRIQAETYVNAMDTTPSNLGNSPSTMGVDIETTTDIDGGYSVISIAPNEWLEYTVTIPADGEYEIALRTAAANANGEINITAGIGPNIISAHNISVPATGGNRNWQTQKSIKLGKLFKGINTIRIDIAGGDFKFNWFELNPISLVAAGEFRKVNWQGQQRFGLLGHASILTATSDNIATNPVKRGVWVLNSLLCDSPPLPDVAPLPIMDDEPDSTPVSTREKFEKILRFPHCMNCHSFIDPIGFGLENYGPIGQWRTEEVRGYYTPGAEPAFTQIGPWPINSSGVLPEGGAFNGPEELSKIIGSSPLLPMCVAKHLATYAIGRNVVAYAPGRVEKEDLGLVKSIYQKTLAKGNRFEDILEELVMSAAFRNRTSAQ